MSGDRAEPSAADMVQVPKEQWDLMLRANKLLQGGWNHPEHGEAMRRLLNKVDPTLPIPEQVGDRIADTRLKPVEERLGTIADDVKAMREERAKEKAEAEEQKAGGDILARLDKVKGRYRFSDEGMELVRQRMLDQKSADVEGAAAFVAGEHAQKPESGDSGLFPKKANLFGVHGDGDEDVAALHKDPLAWQEKELTSMLNDISLAG